MSILTAYRDKQEQKQEHFLHYNVHFVDPNMLMLTLKELCHDLRMCSVLGCSADFLNFPPYWI